MCYLWLISRGEIPVCFCVTLFCQFRSFDVCNSASFSSYGMVYISWHGPCFTANCCFHVLFELPRVEVVPFLFRSRPDMKCIIFVNRIIVARSLAYILGKIKVLSAWKCNYLVGVHSKRMSRNTMYQILEEFRSGEVTFLAMIYCIHLSKSNLLC